MINKEKNYFDTVRFFVKHNTKHKAGKITAQHCTVVQWYILWYGAYFVYAMQNLFQLQKSLFNLHIIWLA